MTRKDVFQEPDDAARRQAKTLIRAERSGALATLEPETGWPMASRVSLATDGAGAPVFLISELSAHFPALVADPRASLLLGLPGKGDPLAHPRITVVGRAERLAGDAAAPVRARFLARHPKAALYADFADFAFWRLAPERAQLNGGFAKAYRLAAEDVLSPTDAALAAMEAEAVAHMNADHADAVKLYAEALLGRETGDWRLVGLDTEGLDLAAGDATARLWFDPPLAGAEELRRRLAALAKEARGES